MALRLAGVSLAARAFPPFRPPIRPSATAAGFFTGGASGFSLMLERLGIWNYDMVFILPLPLISMI